MLNCNPKGLFEEQQVHDITFCGEYKHDISDMIQSEEPEEGNKIYQSLISKGSL